MRKKNGFFFAVALFSAFYLFFSCASQLPRSAKKAVSQDLERAIDLSLLEFEDVDSGVRVKASDYMESNNLNYLLLLFGSVGCAKCNEKAKDISSNYLASHELFIKKEERSFDLIGVNTDSGSAQIRFKGIMLNDTEKKAYGYDFVRWSDIAGDTMRKHLLLPDEKFGVPYTVMLNKQGILWSYPNSQSYTVDSLIERALATVSGQNTENVTPSEPEPKEPPSKPIDVGDFNLLAFATPDRFTQIGAQSCSGQKISMPKITADYLFVQASTSSCAESSGACAKNHNTLSKLAANCPSGKTCDYLTFSQALPPQTGGGLCVSDPNKIVTGASDFFTTFSTHFNWSYAPGVDEFGTPNKIQNLGTEISFAFAKNGALLSSAEGEITTQTFADVYSTKPAFPTLGIDFPVYAGPSTGSTDLKSLRAKTKYTVLNSFDRFCGSCIEELQHWNSANELLDYCNNSEGFCQLIALEALPPFDPGVESAREFYNEIKADQFANAGITVPLLIDLSTYGVDRYSRVFQSYLSPLHPQWENAYGTVIYDREGKIMASFKSAVADDSVFETIQTLRKLP